MVLVAVAAVRPESGTLAAVMPVQVAIWVTALRQSTVFVVAAPKVLATMKPVAFKAVPEPAVMFRAVPAEVRPVPLILTRPVEVVAELAVRLSRPPVVVMALVEATVIAVSVVREFQFQT